MAKSLIGRRVAKLVVLSIDGVYATCKCDCGNTIRVWKANLYRNNTKSCGCLYLKSGGLSRKYPSEHNTWSKMLQRCENQQDKSFHNYGARGITVCARWKKFENFFSDMGRRPTGSTIDRIDNNKGYNPKNCRWATKLTQMRNQRKTRLLTALGRTQNISAWSCETEIPYQTLLQRIKRNVPADIAVSKRHLIKFTLRNTT